jgi:hypothetical protein
MHFPPEQLAALRTFGYTEAEARFLYLVSAHSGYFTLRQFLEFAQAKSGKRNAQLVEKLFRLGHANARRYTRRNLVFQLRSRQIYAAIGKAHLRHRRDHELAHIKTRLLAFDFILANPEENYFETPEEKRRYFVENFNADEKLFLPINKGGGGISFAEGFPLYLAYLPPDFLPVVTFSYLDPEHRSLDRYLAHLRIYRPLFQLLPRFQFLYVSTASGLQEEAAQLFSFLVEGKGLADLAHYFHLEMKWAHEQYGHLSEAEVLFLSENKKRYTGEVIKRLYYLWRRKQLPEDFQPEANTASQPSRKILFRTVTMPGQEGVFGGRAKNWGDGWEIRGSSRATSLNGMSATQEQTLQSAKDA